MHPVILFTVTLLLTYYLLYHLSCKFKKNRLPLPPSPSKLPLIGNLHQLSTLLHRSIQKLSAKHGPLMLLHLGRVPTLVVSSAEMAEQVLKTHDLVFANRPAVKAARFIFNGDNGLAFAPYGEQWRQMRKICVTNLLSSRMVQQFKHVREEEVALLLERITRASASNVKKQDAEVAVPMTVILEEFTNDLISRAVLGEVIRSDAKKKALIKLIRKSSILMAGFYAEDFFPGLWWVDVILGSEGRLKKYFGKVDALLQEILEEHEQMVGSKREKVVHTTTNFAQVLLSLQEEGTLDPPLKNEHIKAIIWEMITAGTDTTSTFLSWMMAELIRNSISMKKVQQELRQKFHLHVGQLVEENDLSDMVYLKAVIKETFRLHAPFQLLVPRESIQECEIQGYIIPKQTKLVVNALSIGRDPQTWEAAEVFRPERWLDSAVDFKGNDFNFLPFGAGRRVCPGIQFAITAIEIVMANLLYFFDWKLCDGLEACDVDMSEAPGITTPRKQMLELIAIPYHVL